MYKGAKTIDNQRYMKLSIELNMAEFSILLDHVKITILIRKYNVK